MRLSKQEKRDENLFKNIFLDHWDEFKVRYPVYDQAQYEDPVQKMLGCGKESNGYRDTRGRY